MWALHCGDFRAGTQDAKTVLEERGPLTRYLRTSFWALTLPLAVWSFATLLGTIALLTGKDWTSLTDGLIDAAWLLLSPVVYVVAYYVFRQPRIFRALPSVAEPTQTALAILPPASAESVTLSTNKVNNPDFERLTDLMVSTKPYLNPGLTISELASEAGMQTYQLSRLINEAASQNFFDYVNGYRIEAFKARIQTKEGERMTILAVALEVGFNSKTAFNRAFKKREGVTPRRFAKSSSLSVKQSSSR